MLATFFPPGRLDPVVDGGVGDENAVVAPQVPTGGLVGQAVFGHQTDRHSLDAAGVQAFGQGQVRQIDTEVATAVGAAMLGLGDNQIDRAARAEVAQVEQAARAGSVATRAATAEPATASRLVAASTFDARLGEVLNAGNTLGDVGDVLAWTSHGASSFRNCSAIFILRPRAPDSGHP